MKASRDIRLRPVPLKYRKLEKEFQSLDNNLILEFKDWFNMLNGFIVQKPNSEAAIFLDKLKDLLRNKGLIGSDFSMFFTHSSWKTKVKYQIRDHKKGIISIFVWEKPL